MEDNPPINPQPPLPQEQNLNTINSSTKKRPYLWVAVIVLFLFGGVCGIYFFLQTKGVPHSRTMRTPEPQISPPPNTSSTHIQSFAIDLEQLPKEIINTKLFYQAKNKSEIYIVDGLGNVPVILGSGELSGSAISADRSTLLYSDLGIDKNLYLYNFSTKNVKKFLQEEAFAPRRILLSPDNSYLYLDYGTSVSGQGKILSYPELSVILPAFQVSWGYGWVNEKEFVFTEDDERFSRLETYGSGITKITLPSGQKQILAAATELDNYSAFEVADGKIYFWKSSVNNKDYWESGEGTITQTTWVMNADGSQKQQITGLTPSRQLSKKIQDALPADYVNYQVRDPQPHPQLPQWVLFWLDKSSSAAGEPDRLVALIDTTNPSTTFQVLTEGTFPMW